MAASRVVHERVLLWRALLVAVCVAAYLALTMVVAATGVISFPIGLATAAVFLGLGLVAFFAHAIALRHLSGLWPGVVFVAAYCAFHFASLGDIDAGWYAPELAPFAWLLSVVSLLGWMLGYSTGRGRAGFVAPEAFDAQLGRHRLDARALRRLSRLGALVFVLGFAVELAIYARAGFGPGLNYLSFKTVMNSQAGLGAVHLLAQMSCVVGAMVCVTCSALRDRKVFAWRWFAVAVGLYVLNLVLQGDRSELGVFLFPFFFVRHYLIRRFRPVQMLGLALVALLTVSGLKAFRASNEAQTVAVKIQDPTWVVHKTADETGHTLDTLVRSLELVPGRYDYFRGKTYVDAVARVVPNILIRRDDAIVSSVWLTEETSERKTAGKGGLGFSIVAEAYINFGAMGAPLVLLLIGLAHGWAERVLTRPRLRLELFALFMVAQLGLLVHVRNSAVLYLRGTVWMSCIVMAMLAAYTLGRRLRGGSSA